MVLSDQDIRKALLSKRISIKPAPDLTTQLGSCSVDLRLGDTFRVFDYSKYAYIDPSKKKWELLKNWLKEIGSQVTLWSNRLRQSLFP